MKINTRSKKTLCGYLAAATTMTIALLPAFTIAGGSDLEVEFSANPSSGTAALYDVDLTAIVSGSASGDITYKFDCTSDGSWDKQITTNSTSYTAENLCDYNNPGGYIAGVSVSRGGLFFEGTTAIMILGSQELLVTLSATPSSGTMPLRDVDLKAAVSGDANGAITYSFDCMDDGAWEKTVTTNNASYTAQDLCDYENTGNYTAKVKVERGGNSFQGTTAVAVFAEGKEPEETDESLSVLKYARNSTDGETSWNSETSASPGDLIEFKIEVNSVGNSSVENVTVLDILPGFMSYEGSVKRNGTVVTGSIADGMSVGTLEPGEKETFIFEARISSEENFPFGSTTLTNTAVAKASDELVTTGMARIDVQRAAVLGAATSVSTGVTEYLYAVLGTLLFLSVGLYFLWQKINQSENKLARILVRKLYLWRSFVIPR